MNKDLKYIKKYYGEDMMHLCRSLFPTILEVEGLLVKLISSSFYHNKHLYEDIVNYDLITEFKDFIYDKIDDKKELKMKINRTPYELLREVGYTLYECKSEEDIQSFKKYYAEDEELCTFLGDRLNKCLVFFAVRDNAIELRREDFVNPERQDEYGTSVISIQYSKGIYNTLSVKNRYNHTVDNPDATFSNNLDNIILGLNDSFEEMYNLSHTGSHNKFEISGYVRANDGRFYKYNYEINGIYYCTDNIIIDNFSVIDKYKDKEKYIIMDYYIIDLMNKRIDTYKSLYDGYINNINGIKKIEVLKDNDKKKIILFIDNDKKIIFDINKYNQMIRLYDDSTVDIPNDSLMYIKNLKEIRMSNARECRDNFLSNAINIDMIDMPLVEYIGDNFLYNNKDLREIRFNNLKYIGNYFLRLNNKIKEIYLPNVLEIKNSFMELNTSVISVNMPSVKNIGSFFISSNKELNKLVMPNLESVLSGFLTNNKTLEIVDLPNLESVRNNFMTFSNVKIVKLPKLVHIGDSFMEYNMVIEEINFPSVETIGSDFMHQNEIINSIYMPNIISIDSYFLYENMELTGLYLPKLVKCGDAFIHYNKKIREVYLPEVVSIGNGFLRCNVCLEELILDNVCEIGDNFLYYNDKIVKFAAPKLKKVGLNVLDNAKNLEYIDAFGFDIVNNHNGRIRRLTK